MEVLLSQNIKANRKRLGLTQEQLAEAMNVSVGTVSKWENGSSVPDIQMIVNLADFFQESVDTLLGYQWRHSSAARTAEYLRTLKMERRYEEGRGKIRRAMQKFPNQPEVLYECGELLYESAVMQTSLCADDEEKDFRNCLEQALLLYRKVILLLEHKDGSDVNNLKIHQKIGIIYGMLGRMEEAVSYLQEHNVFGLNDCIISNFLAELGQYDKAWDTVTSVFQHRIFEVFQCCQVMYYVLINSRKYDDLLQFAVWMENFCRSVQEVKSSYYIRAEAVTDAMIAIACVYKNIGKSEENFSDARFWLQKAVENAIRFDSAPDYSGKTRFTGHIFETMYDGRRESAVLAVQDAILGGREDGKEFSILREIYDDIVSGIGHDEWKIPVNNEKSKRRRILRETDKGRPVNEQGATISGLY